MAVVVEHDKRRREILEKALDVFIEEGYEDATYQKIADRCGITRTTLYLYFKNKRDIFMWSIKQLTEGLEAALLAIIQSEEKSKRAQLSEILQFILDKCAENRRLFSVILIYLLQIQKAGKNPAKRVRRRIIRLRHLLSTVLIMGMRTGEFPANLDVKTINELLYALIESAIFRLAVLDSPNIDELRMAIQSCVEQL